MYDQNAVRTLTKPCTICLEDLYNKDKKVYVTDTEMIENSVSRISSTCSNDVIANYCSPIPLANPRNHCYLNSVLQVLFRLKDKIFTNLLVNNNPEGRLIRSLSDSLHSASESEMDNFKSNLSSYNQFFDGVVQRDAYECFQLVLNILHLGTKQSILGPDSSRVTSSLCLYIKHTSIFYLKRH